MIKVLTTIMLIFLACQAQNLQIATDPSSAPFEFLQDGSTTPVGFDIDFLAAVAKAANVNYDLVQAPFTDIFTQVANNQVDLAISAITITADREQTYDFSVPYFISTQKIIAAQGTDIASAQDLAGKNVGVRNGSTGAADVANLLGDNGNIQTFANLSDGLNALTNGQIDAYVDDGATLDYWANNNQGYVVIEDTAAFGQELFGLLFPKGSDLVDSFNQAITAVLQDGDYATIYANWLSGTPDVALLLAAGEDSNPYEALEEWANEENELNWNDGLLML